MSKKNNRIFAIAVVDAQYLRDFKLRSLDGDGHPGQPEYDKLLRVYGNRAFPVVVGAYRCQETGRVIRRKLTSTTRWKTRAGCEKVAARIEASAQARADISKKVKAAFAICVIDITDCWNDTIQYSLDMERRQYEAKVRSLTKKLITD